MAIRRGRQVVRGPRRATQWLGSADSTTFTTLANSGGVFDQSFAFAEDATIIRTRGSLWVSSD